VTTLPVTYAKLIDSLAAGLVNFHTDAFRAMLLDSYTEGSTATDAQFLADVLAHASEAAGTGYTAGGKLLTGVAWTQDGAGWALTADDVVWPTSSVSAAFAVFFDATPTDPADQPVLGYWDLGGTLASTGTDFTLAINDSGLLTFVAT
jgi:hypothetical protein